MLKGNRTRIFGVIVMCLGVLETYTREIVPQEYQGIVLAIIGILIVVFREITTAPPGRRGDDA